MASDAQHEVAGQLGFVADHRPILGRIGERFRRERPLDGLALAVRIHVEPKAGVLIRVLRDAAAWVIAMGNKGTTNDALTELLRTEDVEVVPDLTTTPRAATTRVG